MICAPTTIVASTARTASTMVPTATAAHRRVSSAHARTRPGWSLTAAPSAPAAPRTRGLSSHRQPITNSRNRRGPTWPSLRLYRNGQDCPASSTITQRVRRDTGSRAIPAANATRSTRDPHPRRRRCRQQAEDQHKREKHRRVEEQPGRTGNVVREVVQRLSVEDPALPRRGRRGSRSRACRRRRPAWRRPPGRRPGARRSAGQRWPGCPETGEPGRQPTG